jgi:hypothetical protein
MTIRPGKLVLRAMVRAAIHPSGLCAGGTLTIAALFWQSGALLGLAAAAYCSVALSALFRRRFWERAADGLRRQPPPLPLTHDFVDPAVRTFVCRLANARFAREEALQRVPDSSRAGTETTAADLEETALKLLYALDRVAIHLTPDTRSSLRAQIDRLTGDAQDAVPAVRAEYGRAVGVLQEKLDMLEALDNRRQLLAARLETVVSALDALAEHLFHAPLRNAADQALADDVALTRITEQISLSTPVLVS